MNELFAMHGYGGYVWSAYGATIFILLFIVIRTTIRQYRLLKLEREVIERNKAPDL